MPVQHPYLNLDIIIDLKIFHCLYVSDLLTQFNSTSSIDINSTFSFYFVKSKTYLFY